VDVGLVVVQNLPWPEWRDRVVAAEAWGYRTAYVWDHLVHRTQELHDPMLDGFGLLAAVAPLTSTIRLGTLVASPTMRHPLLLAKHAVLVDQVSNGRMTLGIGAAGVLMDYTALGIEPWDRREQVERFRDTVELVDAALRGGSSFEGTHYRGSGFSVAPGPVQQPRIPFTIAAHGPRTMRVAAEYAQAWNVLSPRDAARDEAVEQLREKQAAMDAACEEVGRDPATLRRSVLVGSAGWPALSSVEAFVAAAEDYAALGFTELVLTHPGHPAEERLGHGPTDPDLVRKLAEEGALDRVRALA
jgi:alkanesulfonate monooxygenase SsuD/methylene tetrahydromethanopterin reductase-like flavin-dependent oxidoreductase (luciferase family)